MRKAGGKPEIAEWGGWVYFACSWETCARRCSREWEAGWVPRVSLLYKTCCQLPVSEAENARWGGVTLLGLSVVRYSLSQLETVKRSVSAADSKGFLLATHSALFCNSTRELLLFLEGPLAWFKHSAPVTTHLSMLYPWQSFHWGAFPQYKWSGRCERDFTCL